MMRGSAKEEEADPARRDPEAEQDREEAPKQGTGSDQIIYDDEPEETPETGGEAAAGEEEETEEGPSVFDDDDFDRIARGEAEDTEADDTAAEEEAGDAAGGEENGDSDSDVAYDLEGIDEGEKPGLIYNPMPELSDDQVAELPPEIEVEISFTLDPSGRLTSVRMERDTPNSEVNTRIRQAVRTWRFEERDGAETVTGTLRIILRVR
ncbi:MAG: energy transducer TonB [Spirochaetaceae bacterium]